MSVIVTEWTIGKYHRMIDAGILSDRKVELPKGEIVEISPKGEQIKLNSSDKNTKFLLFYLFKQ